MEYIRDKEILVLVVDDNENNLLIIAEVLQKEGYQVITATNGIHALELAKEKTPDAIILDIMMPDMDGFEVCKQIRTIDSLSLIPILFLSVMDEDSNIESGLNLGGTDYITKPFHERVLLTRLKTHIERGYYLKHLTLANQLLQQKNDTLREIKKEIEGINRQLDVQIQKNLHLLATVNDQIRNPLSIAISLIDMSNIPNGEVIVQELKRIDAVIDNLDRGLIESDKIRDYIKKYMNSDDIT